MSHILREILETICDVFRGLREEEAIARSRHKKLETAALLVRNAAAALAVLLFAASLFDYSGAAICKGCAYFLGAAAYFCEIVILTDCFRTKVPHAEMFMAYCFGPMYILLGVSYLLGR